MQRDSGRDIRDDIREFVRFFNRLWGWIAAGALFFPFVNLFVEVLPYPHEDVKDLSGALALICSAFVFLAIYRLRYVIYRIDTSYPGVPLSGHRSLVIGGFFFFCFIVIFLRYFHGVDSRYFASGYWSLEDGIIAYASIFAFATACFTILATGEYMTQLQYREGPPRHRIPTLAMARAAILDRVPLQARAHSSVLRIVEDQLGEEAGIPALTVTAISAAGRRYTVKVDGEGTVLRFEELD